MKLRINGSIDVTKIDKSRIYEGKKGKYLSVTMMVDTDELDQYDNSGFIAEQVSKEERENNVKGTILGNVKVAWKGDSNNQGDNQRAATNQSSPENDQAPASGGSGGDFYDDTIPF